MNVSNWLVKLIERKHPFLQASLKEVAEKARRTMQYLFKPGSAFEVEIFVIGIDQMKLEDSSLTEKTVKLIDKEQKMLMSFQSKLEARN